MIGSLYIWIWIDEGVIVVVVFICFEWDVIVFLNCVEGWGTNEGLIIEILAHRNAEQRRCIRQTYAQTYNEDLLKALDKELTRDFEVNIWFTSWTVKGKKCNLWDLLSANVLFWLDFDTLLTSRKLFSFGHMIHPNVMHFWLMKQ